MFDYSNTFTTKKQQQLKNNDLYTNNYINCNMLQFYDDPDMWSDEPDYDDV